MAGLLAAILAFGKTALAYLVANKVRSLIVAVVLACVASGAVGCGCGLSYSHRGHTKFRIGDEQ